MNKVEAKKKIKSHENSIFIPDDFINRYQIKKIIGRGAYGHVAKAVDLKNNRPVAIKKIT